MVRLLLSVIFLILLTGCLNSRVYQPYSVMEDGLFLKTAIMKKDDAPLSYPYETITPKSDVLTVDYSEQYQIKYLKFSSIGDNGQEGNLVSVRYYQSKLPGKKRTIIVLPIWASYSYPSQKMVDSILDDNKGEANVIMVLGEKDFIDWPKIMAAQDEQSFVQLMKEFMADRVRTTIIDTRRLIDWAEDRPEVDPKRIGIVGFSIGSIVASAALGVDSRISAAALVMGGANPHEILSTCQWEPQVLRETMMERFGWTREQYQAVLKQIFEPLNPTRFEGSYNPQHIIIFDSFYDTCIPASSQDALWKAMGRPERISFLYDHKFAFLAMTPLGANFVTRKINAFFENILRKTPSNVAAR